MRWPSASEVLSAPFDWPVCLPSESEVLSTRFTLPPLVNHGWLLPCHHQWSIICFSLAATSQSRLTYIATIIQSLIAFAFPPLVNHGWLYLRCHHQSVMVGIYLVHHHPSLHWAFNSFSRSKCLELKSFFRSDPGLVWSSQGSRQFYPHYYAEEKDWCFFLVGSCSASEISWTLIGLCVPLSLRYYAHVSLIGLCVPLCLRYYAHICLPILWAGIFRIRDMSSGTFLVGPGIVMAWSLKFSVIASNIMDLSMVLKYPKIWVITGGRGDPGLDLTQVLPFCGPFNSFSMSEHLSCSMKHAEIFWPW